MVWCWSCVYREVSLCCFGILGSRVWVYYKFVLFCWMWKWVWWLSCWRSWGIWFWIRFGCFFLGWIFGWCCGLVGRCLWCCWMEVGCGGRGWRVGCVGWGIGRLWILLLLKRVGMYLWFCWCLEGCCGFKYIVEFWYLLCCGFFGIGGGCCGIGFEFWCVCLCVWGIFCLCFLFEFKLYLLGILLIVLCVLLLFCWEIGFLKWVEMLGWWRVLVWSGCSLRSIFMVFCFGEMFVLYCSRIVELVDINV